MRLALKVVVQNDGDFADVILLYAIPLEHNIFCDENVLDRISQSCQ